MIVQCSRCSHTYKMFCYESEGGDYSSYCPQCYLSSSFPKEISNIISQLLTKGEEYQNALNSLMEESVNRDNVLKELESEVNSMKNNTSLLLAISKNKEAIYKSFVNHVLLVFRLSSYDTYDDNNSHKAATMLEYNKLISMAELMEIEL